MNRNEIEQEIWKDIPGYERFYQASNMGRIKSLARIDLRGNKRKEKILRPSINNDGYFHLTLSKNNEGKTFKVHRLIALTFLDNPHHLPEVHHKDYNKLNNKLENLIWITNIDNIKDAIITHHRGQMPSGEKCHTSRLTEKQVLEIRRLYKTNLFSQYKLADKFNVTQGAIGYVVNYKSWKTVA